MLNSPLQNKDCSICLNSLDNETKCITNCNHEFCIDCIEKWLNINKINCPLCRQQLKEYNSYNLKTKIILINTNELNEHQNIIFNYRIFIRQTKFIFILLFSLIYYFYSNFKYTTLYYNTIDLNNNLNTKNNELQVKYDDCINLH
jgi:hypothetical protein